MSTPIDPREELYKATLMRHYRAAPHRRKSLPEGEGNVWREESRSCGDRLALWFHLEREADGGVRIADACFTGEGCSVSVASADMAVEVLRGRTVSEGGQIAARVLDFLRRLEHMEPAPNPEPTYPDLAALESLARFPTRVACARLAWTAAAGILGES